MNVISGLHPCIDQPVLTALHLSGVRRMQIESSLAGVTQLLRCPVSSAISRIVIKSDHIFTRFPQPGQVVGVSGAPGLYVVMDLDHTNRVAQLMERSGKHRLIKVPFASVRTFNRKLAQAIHRFLESRDDSKKQQR
jgi:hypothetical protein